MTERFVAAADSKKTDEWFVYDNEACSCHAGPMSEHVALHLAIKLNAQEEASKKPKVSLFLQLVKTVALGWPNHLGHVSVVEICADGIDKKDMGLVINGELFTADRILKMQRDLQELGSVENGFEAGFKKGYWWGFENSRMNSDETNILSLYTDVMALRKRNAAYTEQQKEKEQCGNQEN